MYDIDECIYPYFMRRGPLTAVDQLGGLAVFVFRPEGGVQYMAVAQALLGVGTWKSVVVGVWAGCPRRQQLKYRLINHGSRPA